MQFGGTVLYVNDVFATVDFYQRVFSLSLRFSDEKLGYAELETGGAPLAIASHSLGEFLMPGAYRRTAHGPEGVEIAFLSIDIQAAFELACKEGAVPVAGPKRMPWGLEVAYVRAPEGTLIGLSEPPPKPTV